MADIGEHVKSEPPRSTFNESVGDDLTHPIMTTSFGSKLFDLQFTKLFRN